MRELLLAFILALVLGSIINGMQLKPNNTNPGGAAQNTTSAVSSSEASSQDANTPRHDFPDFASFVSVNNANFEQEVLRSQKPVLIDCYVPNNQACDQMIPLIAAVGKKHEDSIIMAKLNIMDNILLAHRYEVSNVPTFLLFDRGELKGKLSGVLPQDRLESMMTPLSSSNGVPQ